MAKKQTKQKLPRLRFVLLGFIFAIIIFSGFLLARLLNNEPPNYPDNPKEVVEEFYTWYTECLDMGSNCDISQTHYAASGLNLSLATDGMTALCSKDPIESFEINSVQEEDEKALVDLHASTTTGQEIHIEVGTNKVRGIWKIVSITCGR